MNTQDFSLEVDLPRIFFDFLFDVRLQGNVLGINCEKSRVLRNRVTHTLRVFAGREEDIFTLVDLFERVSGDRLEVILPGISGTIYFAFSL